MMKLRKCQNKLTLTLMLVLTPCLAIAEVQDLQVNKLIIKAIDSHPSVAAAVSQQKAAQEGITAAKRNLLPMPSVRSGYQEKQDLKTQVSIRQSLWSGGRLTANINQAIFDDKAAIEKVFEEQNTVAKSTIDAWQQYVNAIMSQRVYSKILKQLGEFEAMMQRRVNQGVSARIEMDLLTNRIIQQQSLYQAAQEKERIAVARLEQMLGEPMSRSISYSITPLEKMVQEAKREASNYEDMVFDEASFRNATVVREFFEIEAAKQSLEADKSKNLPTVYAEYVHSFNHSEKRDNGQFSLGVQYEPGAGFSNFALSRASQARVDGLVQSQEASRRAVLESIQVQYQRFAGAKDKELSLIAAAAGSKIVVDSYRRQFIAGRKTWLEVLNSVREHSDDKIKLVNTRTEMLGSFYKLQVDLGKMQWQQFQFNREAQPLFHPADPFKEWMKNNEHLEFGSPSEFREFLEKSSPLKSEPDYLLDEDTIKKIKEKVRF